MDYSLLVLVVVNLALLVWLTRTKVFALYPAFTVMTLSWLLAESLTLHHSAYAWDARIVLLVLQLLAGNEAAQHVVEFNYPPVVKSNVLMAAAGGGVAVASIMLVNPVQFNVPAKYAFFSVLRNALHGGLFAGLLVCVLLVWAYELWAYDPDGKLAEWDNVNAVYALLLAVRFGVDAAVNLRPARAGEGGLWRHQHLVSVWLHIITLALLYANLRRLASRRPKPS